MKCSSFRRLIKDHTPGASQQKKVTSSSEVVSILVSFLWLGSISFVNIFLSFFFYVFYSIVCVCVCVSMVEYAIVCSMHFKLQALNSSGKVSKQMKGKIVCGPQYLCHFREFILKLALPVIPTKHSDSLTLKTTVF